MAKIVKFDDSKGYNTGYKYFAKAVLESLWRDAPEETLIHILDRNGKYHEITGAQIIDDVVTIFI